MFGCAGAVKGGRPSPEPSFTSLQQTLTARPWSAHQAREQSLSVGECDRVVDIIPLTPPPPFTSLLPPSYEVLGQGRGKGQWVDAHSNYLIRRVIV